MSDAQPEYNLEKSEEVGSEDVPHQEQQVVGYPQSDRDGNPEDPFSEKYSTGKPDAVQQAVGKTEQSTNISPFSHDPDQVNFEDVPCMYQEEDCSPDPLSEFEECHLEDHRCNAEDSTPLMTYLKLDSLIGWSSLCCKPELLSSFIPCVTFDCQSMVLPIAPCSEPHKSSMHILMLSYCSLLINANYEESPYNQHASL